MCRSALGKYREGMLKGSPLRPSGTEEVEQMEVKTARSHAKVAFAALGLITVAAFGPAARAAVETETLDAATLPYERVDSIPALGGLRGFDAVDDETLILWATSFDPYLVRLAYPSPDLRWAQVVAVESATSLIHERFDAVRIDGLRYPIEEIYKLSREQARQIDR